MLSNSDYTKEYTLISWRQGGKILEGKLNSSLEPALYWRKHLSSYLIGLLRHNLHERVNYFALTQSIKILDTNVLLDISELPLSVLILKHYLCLSMVI